MAEYTIAAGESSSTPRTLAAGVEDVVHLPLRCTTATVIVFPGTSSPVYIGSGASAITVGDNDAHAVFPGWAAEVDVQTWGPPYDASTPPTSTKKVRLICAVAATYVVEV